MFRKGGHRPRDARAFLSVCGRHSDITKTDRQRHLMVPAFIRPRLIRSGGDGDGATAAMPTSVWGVGDEVAAAMLGAVPTRKRKHMAAARADDTDDGATATAVSAAGIGHADASSGIDAGVAADPGRVVGGVPDRGLDADASADAYSSVTKKRR